jgi:hypothetical protein
MYGRLIAEFPYKLAVTGAAVCFFGSALAGSRFDTAVLRALVGAAGFWMAGIVLGVLAAAQTTEG